MVPRKYSLWQIEYENISEEHGKKNKEAIDISDLNGAPHETSYESKET